MTGRRQSISCMPSKLTNLLKRRISLNEKTQQRSPSPVRIEIIPIVPPSGGTIPKITLEQEEIVEDTMEQFVLDMHIKASQNNRRQSIAADEYQKGHRGSTIGSWLRQSVGGRRSSNCGPSLKIVPLSRVAGWLMGKRWVGNIDSLSERSTERTTEQLMFDIHLNSPSKSRRQQAAIDSWDEERMRSVCHPSSTEKTMEQVIFDIYLNSPTKERRQLEAAEAWEEKQKEIRERERAVSCLPRCLAAQPQDFLDIDTQKLNRRSSM